MKRAPKVNLGDLVLITWADHHNDTALGWQILDAYKIRELLIETVGFVVAQDAKHIAVSPTFSPGNDTEHDQYCGGVSVRIKQDIQDIQILRKA